MTPEREAEIRALVVWTQRCTELLAERVSGEDSSEPELGTVES